MATHADIGRFLDAQDAGQFESALAEITSGRKVGHWIWYVFPQLAGLGQSHMSRTYGIRDRHEAAAYLKHPILRSRLLDITSAAAEHVRRGARLDRLMGSSIDAQKLVSSLTLFGHLAKSFEASGDKEFGPLARLANEILAAAKTQGYAPCRYTLDQLGED
jgi:uncharacterized protein (DUF1810 family)